MDLGLLALLAAGLAKGLMMLAGYMRSGTTFPEPLSREDEAHYLARLQEGDEQARDILIEHNLRLVAHIVKKYANSGEDTEDLISIGTIGLIKGVSTFDPDRGTKLATYAARCIENEILMHLRATKRKRGERSLEEPIGRDGEGNEITLMDILQADGRPVVEAVDQRFDLARLQGLMEELTQRERRVIEMRYGLEGKLCQTQREIASRLGISRSYVSRIEKKAVRKLAEHMIVESS